MEYKIVMPVLSDTMERGKLIKWHVKEGDIVHKGDIIAEVESDKAIMEVQSFKDGVVKKLLAKEGEEIPVKEPIAIIDTETKASLQTTPTPQKEIPKKQPPKEPQPSQKQKSSQQLPPVIEELLQPSPPPQGDASPAAKKRAAELGVDIEALQQKGELPKPAHIEDVEVVALRRYFSPKALELLKVYNLDPSHFSLDHKIKSEEVMDYIKAHNIPQIVTLSKNRLAVIKTVEAAAKKPYYLIFEEFEIKKYEDMKLTSIILKTMGDVMQRHPLSRARLQGDRLAIYPHSNISVAVARGDDLYMVVCKNIEEKSLKEIDKWVREIKHKDFDPDDLRGSTFGLSNLGMFGIKSFSAMINPSDVGIAAFGALEDGKVAVTFTIDHRIMNGVDAAKFVVDLKKAFKGEEDV